MAKPIFITGFWHETNTFSQMRTDIDAFRAYQYAEGDGLFAAFADTNTEIGGVMNAARSLLGWNQPKLAAKSGVSLPTISRMELSADFVGGHARNVYAVLDAFDRAGIEFQNGDAPGVRLRKTEWVHGFTWHNFPVVE